MFLRRNSIDRRSILPRAATANRLGAARKLRVESLEPRVVLTGSAVISEFLTVGEGGVLDEDGERSDWIEIYNSGDTPLELAGWHLTDDIDDPQQWTFPPVTIAADGYLVVFASGKDRVDSQSELHTNFRLDRDGEFLSLTDPTETIVSQYAPR